MSERILVIQLAKLGDFIQSTPLLANIRRSSPGAEIVLAAEQPAVIEAAELSPLVDKVVKATENSQPPQGNFEAVYVLNSHRRAAALAEAVNPGRHYGPKLSGGQLVFTEAQRFLMEVMATGRMLGRFNLVDVWNSLVPQTRPEPLSWPGVESGGILDGIGGRKVGFQLGSRNHLRRWPVEHFAAVATALAGRGLDIRPVLLGASGEKALGRKFEHCLGDGVSRPVNLIGSTGLKSLGEALAGLDLLISADTGTMHLAAAVKTPVLALFFGPAFGPETGPYGPGHLIYQASAPCSPCREGAGCRLKQCREMPEPAVAARLAEAMLRSQEAYLAGHIDWPAGHRVWATQLDGFGQVLAPVGQPFLTPQELQACLLTELGRAVLRPGYEIESISFSRRLGAYARPLRVDQPEVEFLKTLIGRTFARQPSRAAELSSKMEQLSSNFGLKLALT